MAKEELPPMGIPKPKPRPGSQQEIQDILDRITGPMSADEICAIRNLIIPNPSDVPRLIATIDKLRGMLQDAKALVYYPHNGEVFDNQHSNYEDGVTPQLIYDRICDEANENDSEYPSINHSIMALRRKNHELLEVLKQMEWVCPYCRATSNRHQHPSERSHREGCKLKSMLPKE